MSRELLQRIIKLMFGGLFLAWLFVLLMSAGGKPSNSLKQGATMRNATNSFDDVQLGETAFRYYQGQRVWVTRWTSVMRDQHEQITAYVETQSACNLSLSVCALSASTQLDGIDLRFVDSAPPQLTKSIPWYGGFVDPTSGRVFDRAGRGYKGQADAQSLVLVTEF